MALREDQIRRYARHVLLPDVGGRGQERLLAAEVTVEIGPGRAAEVAALAYLAAAGVGRLVLCGDTAGPLGAGEVARGILYRALDAGAPRGRAVRARIEALNPDVTVVEGLDPGAGPGAWRLADQMGPDPADPTDSIENGDHGVAVADALFRGGAAAARTLALITGWNP